MVRAVTAWGSALGAAAMLLVLSSPDAAAGSMSAGCSPPPADQIVPIIHEVQLGATAIDVSAGPVEVPVRARVTDDGGSGLAKVLVFIGTRQGGSVARWSPGHEGATAVLLPEQEDWWAGTITVGQWDAYASPWGVSQASAFDAAGNYGQLTYADFLGEAATTPTFTIAPHPVDNQQPYLAELTVNRRIVDVRRHPRPITVTARVTDTGGSGVIAVSVVDGPQLHRVSGTTSDGWWQGTVVVPRWIRNGYHPIRLAMHDAAYNGTWTRPDLMRARHLPWRYQARSITDDAPPRVAATRLSPLSADVSAPDRRLAVRVRLTDQQSGVATARAQLVRMDGDLTGLTARFHLVGGDHRDGWWRASITLPGCGALTPGTFRVVVELTDRIGNTAHRGVGPEVRIDDAS